MTLEEALRKAHNRCPLAHIKTFIDGKPQSCGWQGHAAIDLLAKVAALEQAEKDYATVGRALTREGARSDLGLVVTDLRREVEKHD